MRQLVGGSADSYLQSKFNFLPLLRDITVLANSVENVKGQLKRLTDEARRPLKKHFSANLGKFRNSTDSISSGTGATWPASVTYQRFVTYDEHVFRATLEYSYELTDAPEDLFRRGLMDYLGLQVSPQVVWNAIPWSFVVDWFLGVSPWLDQFTMRHLGIVTHISKAGWSVKVKRKAVCSVDPYGQVVECLEESYFRTPATPQLVSSLKTSGLNPTEFLLGSSLVVTHK